MHGFGGDKGMRAVEPSDRVQIRIFVMQLAPEPEFVAVGDKILGRFASGIGDGDPISPEADQPCPPAAIRAAVAEKYECARGVVGPYDMRLDVSLERHRILPARDDGEDGVRAVLMSAPSAREHEFFLPVGRRNFDRRATLSQTHLSRLERDPTRPPRVRTKAQPAAARRARS